MSHHPGPMIAKVQPWWFGEVRQMSAMWHKETINVTQQIVGLLGVQLTILVKYRSAAVRRGPSLSSRDPQISRRRSFTGLHATENTVRRW